MRRKKLARTMAAIVALDAAIAGALTGCAIDFDRFDPAEGGAATDDGSIEADEGASVMAVSEDGAVTSKPMRRSTARASTANAAARGCQTATGAVAEAASISGASP